MMAETSNEPVEPVLQKTCALKASIHCEGCKRKVKKILSQVQGVSSVDVDTKQQKVTVIGNVDADCLISKLVKAGKHAELWPPEKTVKSPTLPEHGNNTHEKHIDKKQAKVSGRQKEAAGKAKPSSKQELEPSSVKAQTEAENDGSVADGTNNKEKSGCSGGATANKAVTYNITDDASAKPINGAGAGAGAGAVDQVHEQRKSHHHEVDKFKARDDGSKTVLPKAEDNTTKATATATGGKKKKKKGQNGNLGGSATPTAATACGVGGGVSSDINQEHGPPMPSNHSPPRHLQWLPQQHHYYAPPVYAVSYNTAHPNSTYTASYYTTPPQPSHSYAYAYSGTDAGTPQPPLDPLFEPHQPLDSFEIFSDENPNGCAIA